MTFEEFQKICENEFHTVRLADIALELGVTPQVINNWKSRNTVPYKYVKIIRKKIAESSEIKQSNIQSQLFHTSRIVENNVNTDDGFKILFFVLRQTFNSIKNNLVIFFLIPSIMIIKALAKVISLEPIFLSEAKIIPSVDGSGSVSQISSIAANFGISTGSSSGGSITSANLFPEVIKSRRLARTLLKRNFNTTRYGENKPLVSILTGVEDLSENSEDYDGLMKAGISDLGSRIEVHLGSKTPLITIRVFAFEAQLAADIAGAVVDELNNLQKLFKSSRLNEKKIFIEGRIKDVEKALVKAEEELKYFRETNRNILKSPSLQLEQERYLREVSTQMQVFLTLKSQIEIVQIELVEKTNMLDILDMPEAPLQKIGPNRRIIMIIVAILSTILSLAIVYVKHWYEKEHLSS